MRRTLGIAVAAAVIAGVTGCADARVDISADKPPSPTTWPKYPHFSQHSCWGPDNPPAPPSEPAPSYDETERTFQLAPSYAPAPRAHPIAPTVVVRRLLARFGDRRYVRAVRFWPARPRNTRSWYEGGPPPADALRAQIVVAPAKPSNHPSPRQSLRAGIAQWERRLVGAALRDDMCDAGGPPLIKWGVGNGVDSRAESVGALGQRFPNPSPNAFRKRVALVGRRFGFTVASLRLLRPRQLAPLLIVKTHRSRKAFVSDIGDIMELLDPVTDFPDGTAGTFEGFFFAAEDARGPFIFSERVMRHDAGGDGWVANPCLYAWGDGTTGAGGPCS